MSEKIAVLIPAYKPDEKLVNLIEDLYATGLKNVLVINDGSGESFEPIFDQVRSLGCTVLEQPRNMGKGLAIKTGLKYLIGKVEIGVITADADGQHSPQDILKIAEALEKKPYSMILGVRDLTQMPPRSRIGNTMTKAMFRFACGLRISDTQTGLRGLPARSMKWMSEIKGDRYEYETNVLLDLSKYHVSIVEIPISTLYIDDNKSSHFRPIRDGVKIYVPILKRFFCFVGSSLFATGVDYALFTLIYLLITQELIVCVAGARIISSLLNFLVNRKVVFKTQNIKHSLWRYYLLATIIMLTNYALLELLTEIGVMVFIAKLFIDVSLFIVNFIFQRKFVFVDNLA